MNKKYLYFISLAGLLLLSEAVIAIALFNIVTSSLGLVLKIGGSAVVVTNLLLLAEYFDAMRNIDTLVIQKDRA